MPYYHVIIGVKDRPEEDALATDMSEEGLIEKVVQPISEGRKFACHDELVDPAEIVSIKITKTVKPILEVIGGSFFPEEYAQYWEAANSGQDVTADYITEEVERILASSREASRKKIFIVHGRDHKPMKELKEMLTNLGLDPIVLHEQASGSRTIVEKLEMYSDVGYVFAVLTPDDLGFHPQYIGPDQTYQSNLIPTQFMQLVEAGGNPDELIRRARSIFRPRARQNVVLEFGYFIGSVGRDKVCCLYRGDVELPSDMQGIVLIPFRESIDEVREKITRELKAAGYCIKG